MNEFDVEGFDYGEFERKIEEIRASVNFVEYTEELNAIVKRSPNTRFLLPLYPLDAIHEYLKDFVDKGKISQAKAAIFEEKYLYLGGSFPIYKLIALWGDNKYQKMVEELLRLQSE